MNKPESSSLGSTENLEYANLVERLTETMQAGQKIDWSEVARLHPEWLEKIKAELRTIQTLLDAGNITSSDFSGDEIATGKMPTIEGYQLLRRIGAGGMGIVYEAIELSLQRKVAIKVLSAQLRPNSRVRVRFENEATAAGRLNHPNILPVYQIGESAGLMFYAMPYIDGQTLSEIAALPDKDRSYSSIATIIYQTALALDHAHESGIFHRDVKPSNIMLDRYGHVWLLDFGLASLDEQLDLTQTGEIIGTLRYMSPERLAPKTVRTLDRRLDVYSLGATLYELLSGLPPYHDVSKPALNKAIQETQPTSVKQLAPKSPLALVRICEKAMEREPADRYTNCLEMGEDIQRFLSGQEVEARPLSRATKVVRYIRQHSLAILAATSIFTLLLAVTLVLLQRNRSLELQQNTIEYQNKLVDVQAKDLRRQNFYLELTKLREARECGTLGWRSQQIETLTQLASEGWSDKELEQLQREWIATSQTVDLQEEQVLHTDHLYFCCAWNKFGTQLVAGLTIAERDEPAVVVYSGEPLRAQFEIKLPTQADLGVGELTNDGVRSLCFSTDQRRLWVGTRRGLVHQIDMANGQVVHSKACFPDTVWGLAIQEDFNELVTGSSNGKIMVIDLKTLETKQTFDTQSPIRSFVLRNSSLMVLGINLKQSIRDAVKWPEPTDVDLDVNGILFEATKDGTLLYSAQPTGVKYLSRDTNEVTRAFDFKTNQTNPQVTNAHKVVPVDGDLLLSTDSNGLTMWNQLNGNQWGTLPIVNNENAGVCYKPNSRKVAIWGHRKLAIYQINRSEVWGATPATPYPVNAFHLQNRVNSTLSGVLVSTRNHLKGVQPEEYLVQYVPWDKREKNRARFYGKGPVAILGAYGTGFISHQHDDDFLMWSSWNRSTWDDRFYFPFDSEFCTAHDPIKNVVYCSWRLRSGDLSPRVRYIPEMAAVNNTDHTIAWNYKPIPSHDTDTSFAIKSILPAGDHVYLACDDQMIRELDAVTGVVRRTMRIENQLGAAMAALGSQYLLLASVEGHVSVIDLRTGKLEGQQRPHENRITAIQALEDGMFVTGSIDGDLVISRWEDQRITEILRVPHADVAIDQLQVTTDGERICYRCRNEYTVRYLDWKKLLRELELLKKPQLAAANK
jgi:serine/threonine protein kinase